MNANSYIEIDIDAYIHNINLLKNICNKKLMAIIKADGYGMIDHIAANILKDNDVNYFGVSSLLEAISLRNHGIDTNILVLGYIDINDLKLAKSLNLAISSISKDYIYSIDKDVLNGLKIHLAIDTGMHRIGLYSDEVKEVLNYLLDNNALVEGIFTHFAKSDDDIEFTTLQFNRFKDILDNIDYQFKFIHTSNTDATINFHDDISNYVRCGIGLLGFSSFKTDLKPCISLYTTITNSRLTKAKEGVGYGQTYYLDKDGYILTCGIGYADGLLRINKNRKVFVCDDYYPIVGNICMDQMMLLADKNIKQGTKVEIFGNHISLYDMAKELNTIPYEILTNLSDRLERRYYKNQKLIFTYDPRLIK